MTSSFEKVDQELSAVQNNFVYQFNSELQLFILQITKSDADLSLLTESVSYSLLNGGKRFRPFLIWSLLEDFKIKNKKLYFDYALSVEMIHTYSLIHDDLPCMDNDDYRRGQLTNHKVYGEDIALLAGDSLLTFAFQNIAESLLYDDGLKMRLIQLLSKKAGHFGMIGGQVLDMKATSEIKEQQLTKIHHLKTGALISAALEGAGLILKSEISNFRDFDLIEQLGKKIGFAFQIKDDLLDIKDNAQEFKNFVAITNFETTQSLLKSLTDEALSLLDRIQKNLQNEGLIFEFKLIKSLIYFNLNREK